MTQQLLETRTGKPGSIELRAKSDGTGALFGYALTYGNYSRDLGGFVEQVAPGAVDSAFEDGVRVMARWNHDNAYLLGATDAGTLRLQSDDVGLLYDIDLPKEGPGPYIRELASRGDLKYSSFAFYCIEDVVADRAGRSASYPHQCQARRRGPGQRSGVSGDLDRAAFLIPDCPGRRVLPRGAHRTGS